MTYSHVLTSRLPENPKSGKRKIYRLQLFECIEEPGAGERIRTVDPNLGKVMLYP